MARCILLMFVAVFAFASLQIAESLKCYHCASAPGGECDNPTKNASFIAECNNSTGSDPVCYIRNTTLSSSIEILRGCSARSECKSFQSAAGNSTCTPCEKDLCNSSTGLVPSTFFIFSIISAIIAKLYL